MAPQAHAHPGARFRRHNEDRPDLCILPPAHPTSSHTTQFVARCTGAGPQLSCPPRWSRWSRWPLLAQSTSLSTFALIMWSCPNFEPGAALLTLDTHSAALAPACHGSDSDGCPDGCPNGCPDSSHSSGCPNCPNAPSSPHPRKRPKQLLYGRDPRQWSQPAASLVSPSMLAAPPLDLSSRQSTATSLAALTAHTACLKSHLNLVRAELADSLLTRESAHLSYLTAFRYSPATTFKGSSKVLAAALSSDHHTIASVQQDGFCVLWDAHSTEKLDAFRLADEMPLSVALSPSASLVATAGLSNVCSVYPVDSLAEPAVPRDPRSGPTVIVPGSVPGPVPASVPGPVPAPVPARVKAEPFGMSVVPPPSSSARASYTSTSSYSSSSGGAASIASREPAAMLYGHDGFISRVAFVHSDDRLVTSSADMSLCVWDVERSAQLCQMGFGDNLGSLNSVDVHPSSPFLFLSAGADGSAKIWDLRDPHAASMSASTHNGEVTDAVWFPSGDCICTGSSVDSTVRLYDLRYDGQIGLYPLLNGPAAGLFSCLRPTPSGRALLIGRDNGHVLQLDTLKAVWCQAPLAAHSARVSSLMVAPEGRWYSAAWDGCIYAFEPTFY